MTQIEISFSSLKKEKKNNELQSMFLVECIIANKGMNQDWKVECALKKKTGMWIVESVSHEKEKQKSCSQLFSNFTNPFYIYFQFFFLVN